MKVMHSSTPYKVASCILSFIMMFHTTGCKNYFMIEGVPTDNIASIENIDETYNSVVIHGNGRNSNYILKEAKVNSMSVSGLLSLSENEFDYGMYSWYPVYKAKDKKNINVVHIYLKYSHPKLNPGRIKIDAKDISKIEIVKKNKTKTTMSHIIGWAGISVVAALIIAFAINPPVGVNLPISSF